jgi:chromosome partitioning protein
MIVAVMNQKGGTGKTATAFNVGGILASLGRRVLLVDADPQSSLSICFNVDQGGLEDAIMDGRPLVEAVTSVREHLDLVPTTIQLARVELGLLSDLNREYRLRNALHPLRGQYDTILIDCPPSLAMMAVNCLAAADAVLIVMSCDFQALMSVQLLYESILTIRRQVNPTLSILGLVRTRYDGRTNHSEAVSRKAVELFADYFPIFDTLICERTAIKDAAAARQLVVEYQPKGGAAAEYTELAEELWRRSAATRSTV